MESEHLRIEEDLRGQLAGDVRCDDVFTEIYASDASLYQIRPLGVVRPRSTQDVAATVKYAAEHKIPIHPRGAGSSLSGGPLGRGLVIDFSRYFRRISLGEGDEVRVQAGVVLERLNRKLARDGRRFGPDPENLAVSTVGGAIARDASGSRWLAYGSVRDHVRSLEVVLADGTITTLGRHPLEAASDPSPAGRLASGVREIVDRHRVVLEEARTQSRVDRSGYHLRGIVTDGQVNLGQLVVGSEGTLALVTEATVTVVPEPAFLGGCLLMFNSLASAAEAAVELSTYPLRACDLLDRRHLSLARELDPRYDVMIPKAVEAVLLVEVGASSAERVVDLLQDVENMLVRRRQLAASAILATHPDDRELMWQLVSQAAPRLYQLRSSERPIPLFEDIAIPPAELPRFLQGAIATMQRRQVTASVFAHAGHGVVHMRPFCDVSDVASTQRMIELAGELYEQVWALGGTISGEEGEGLSRAGFVARQQGARRPAFEEVKQLFDPLEILNPGKKSASGTRLAKGTLRQVTARADDLPPDESLRLPVLQLDWSRAEMAYAARACNGCGACRTQAEDQRMCPIFRYSPREEASPRAKANLARGLLTETLSPETVVSDTCKQLADLCVHCHMCRIECPSQVDVPKLMMEAKASYVATNGLEFTDRMLVRIDRLLALAARMPRIANWAIRNRLARWILERTLGIAQGRKLPRIARQPFLQSSTQRHHRRAEPDAPRKALYFVDTYANYCDTRLAESLVAVLEHNNVRVWVPGDQREAGMPMIAHGLLEPAVRLAERNVAMLAEAVRHGYDIVTTEPSAALAIAHEYLQLLPGDGDAQLVAEHTFDACHYLWRLHQQGLLRLDFEPVDLVVGYHQPCHSKALQVGTPTVNLLQLIPQLRIVPIEKGCSGIAGLYGFKRANYRKSLRVGLPLLTEMRTGRFQVGVTDCSTCRVQMEQGVAKTTLHPIKLVALAYQLMPEIRDVLHRTNDALIVR
jgi:FAD/FMN-containing dehydrogenase/Fe-S oxidoreductase